MCARPAADVGPTPLEVLAQARAEGLATPVIIITARGTLGDKILGLNTGADDYLPKPFDLDELEARIRALLRRQGQPEVAVPLLVEVLTAMTPASEQGRKAYQQLLELWSCCPGSHQWYFAAIGMHFCGYWHHHSPRS